MSEVVRTALRVASTINVVKTILLVCNAIAGASLIVVGGIGSQQENFNVFSGAVETVDAASVSLILAGVATLVLGSLLIYVLLGWFEHVLRTLVAIVQNTTLTPLPPFTET